jgi:hypothetical protein
MSNADEMPLDRAQTKREQIERELKKCPDFQLYLATKSREGRARMERVLMEIPNFRLWRMLTKSIERAQPRVYRSGVSISGRNAALVRRDVDAAANRAPVLD